MSARYKRLRDGVATVMAEVDTMGITDGNPDPVGEYSGEAAELARRILRLEAEGDQVTSEAVTTFLREIFHREFEIDLDARDAARMTTLILELRD